MFYLAIDQHSNQLTVNLRDESGDVVLQRQVSTKPERVETFFESLAASCEQEGGYVVILEVCGFNDWLLRRLQQTDSGCREIVLVQPEKRRKQKTDRRDASQLGETLWVNRNRLLAGKRVQNIRRVAPASTSDAADRQLTELRKRLGAQRTRVLNKVWRIVHKHNLQHNRPTKGMQTKRVLIWLKDLALPAIDRLELNQLLSEWELLEEHLALVNQEIDKRHQTNRRAQQIASMPGLGKYSSLAIGARIGEIDRFPRGASLANFFGVAPGCRNSGNDAHRPGSITKQGSGTVRFLLGQVVLHVLRKDPWMRQWYRQVKRRRGSRIARVAVMRRLVTILWSMLKYDMPYVSGGPEEFRKARERIETLRQEANEAEHLRSGSAKGGSPLPPSPSLGPSLV